MKIKYKFKTLNYENLKIDVKKCLSPVLKKVSKRNISSNINQIKSLFNSYDLSLINRKEKNNELIRENNIFKHHLNKYNSYKNFLDKKKKHKNKGKQLSQIENLKIKYFNRGYKIPKLSNNLFKISPLNFQGISIRQYFNELYKKEKKEITLKEKNVDFLSRLEKAIKDMKIKKNSYIIDTKDKKTVNISPRKRIFNIKQQLKKTISKSSTKSIKTIDNKDKDIKSEINKNKYLSDYDLLEEDEEFKELNQYEKNRIIKLLKEEEKIKKYNKFINNILKDKSYFQVIDTNDIELKHEEQKNNNNNNTINPNKMISSKTIKHIKRNSKISISNSEDNSFSSEYRPFKPSNQTMDYYTKTLKNIHNNKPKIILTNDNININSNNKKNSNKSFFSRNIKNYPKLKKSQTLKNVINLKSNLNKNNQINNYISDTINPLLLLIPNKKNINKSNKTNKRFSYSIKPDMISNFLKTINENKEINLKSNDNNLSKNCKILKKFNGSEENLNNFMNYQTINGNGLKKGKFINKQQSLNYLFKRINSDKNLDDEFINEYKRYFIQNKNVSEDFLNKYINRKYDIHDFVNLCISVDQKIKEGNIINKWKKNYLRIGKFEEIKPLLREEAKQDYYINHLLQNYMNSKNGKRNYYDYDPKDIDSIQEFN